MNWRKLFLLGTKLLDSEGNEEKHLTISKTFIHTVSMMVVVYLFGIFSAAVSILPFLGIEVSRPAFNHELVEISEDSQKERLTLKINLAKETINRIEIDLEIKRNLLEDNHLSIDYAKDTVSDQGERRLLVTAYKKEGRLISLLMADLEADKKAQVAKIKHLDNEIIAITEKDK